MDDSPSGMIDIDALGLKCPMPVLRLARVLRGAPDGAAVRLLADDAMAAIDVPHFCAEGGHDLIETGPAREGRFFIVRKGARPA